MAAIVLDASEGPRAMRTRVSTPHRAAPAATEVFLELPPAGALARVLALVAGPIVYTVGDIAEAVCLQFGFELRPELFLPLVDGLVESGAASVVAGDTAPEPGRKDQA